MKTSILILFFFIGYVQFITSQSPILCGDQDLIIVNESQIAGNVSLVNCEKNLLITTTDNDIEVSGLIQIHKNYAIRIVPTENYSIKLKFEEIAAKGGAVLTERTKLGNSRDERKIEEESTKARVVIYPNPVEELLSISVDSTILNYQIINAYGTTYLKGNELPTNTINVSTLQSGLYYIRIQTENTIITTSFYKN